MSARTVACGPWLIQNETGHCGHAVPDHVDDQGAGHRGGEQALLRGGELGGTRILRQSTVDAAFRNQIGELDFPGELPTADPAVSCTFRAGPGCKWGYGLLLSTADIPGRRRAWSGGWGGLCNTQFWIDRTTGICASIYSNFLPFVTPEAVKLYNDFENALYASL
jgi:methyl acetate hydrolase